MHQVEVRDGVEGEPAVQVVQWLVKQRTCAGLLGALGAAGRLGEILQASDTSIAAPLREVLTQGRDDGVLAAGEPADAANAILGGLLLAVLGRAMTGADPTEPRFRQHLADQLLRGVMTG